MVKGIGRMGPNRPRKRRNHSSPTRTRPLASSGFDPTPSASRPSTLSPTGVSVLDRHLVTEEVSIDFFEKLRISPDSDNNPRSFPYNVKQQCWEKAEKVRGRDPERWRRDPLGNTVFRKLVGCPGCLCHDYDHIVPYSKGGKSTLENCQVLQATVNRSKGNRTEISRADLIQKSSYCRVSGRDMDLLELSAYGNVRRGQDSGGCRIQ
ncbi:hypothetical protein RHMOL_Rhmol08G0208800 [Rhododendron molle]|uniref:Uncharacterized protein n=1 Tax=Rhododendron molle TaxID=49168 RepID=A0ACC0MQK1_RHOML|nr:hypothetical protein RHMOL_Rhmol08G0208800 [Rhododendron molle]